MDGFHALRGLDSHRRDGRNSIAVMGGDRFEVRGNPCACGRIETRDREHDGRGHIHVIGQCFESLREKNRPQKSGPAALGRRASRQFEMYARVPSHATPFLPRGPHPGNKSQEYV